MVFSTLALHFQPVLQCSSKEVALLWIKNVGQDRKHLSEMMDFNWVFKVVRIIKPISFLYLLMEHMLPEGKAAKLQAMTHFFPRDAPIVFGCSNHIDVCLGFGLSIFICFILLITEQMVVIDSWFLPLIGQAGGWSQICDDVISLVWQHC